MKERYSVVAGAFYENSPSRLKSQIEGCFLNPYGPGELPKLPISKRLENSIGVMVPHAGYIYSGPVASHAYFEISRMGFPDIVVAIGPNHTGYGKPIGVYDGDAWVTPLGRVEVATDITHELASHCEFASLDALSHKYEHSIEVQLPFLQYIYGNSFSIVPICMMDQHLRVAKGLSKCLKEILSEKVVLIVASSDMDHYEDHETVVEKDKKVLEKIEVLDTEGMYEEIKKNHVTMCGYGPVSVAMNYGFPGARLLKHATSGDITGDKTKVVGYAAVLFSS
ncbi:MAG: AmmeMemoRadiSam system protein B [Thermotoga sp.]|nr:MAG: AmmeMemoRadiSam system protein B [Thermotoga sp.]